MRTHRERITEALRLSRLPLDDDQLSERTGIRPRQAVNQACRALERDGFLRRYTGGSGKLVNELTVPYGRLEPSAAPAVADDHPASPLAAAQVELADSHETPPGSSREQRDAERVMLDLLGAQLGLVLEPARITVPSGARVEVDGADPHKAVLVECWAHHGAPKAAQKHKLLADALKLTWISSTIYPRPRLILCLSDMAAAAPFLPTARSWAAVALKDLGISVLIVTLPEELRRRVVAAQERQYR